MAHYLDEMWEILMAGPNDVPVQEQEDPTQGDEIRTPWGGMVD